MSEAEEQAAKQKTSFGIVIYDEAEDRSAVLKTIRSIKNMNYDRKDYGTVLSVRRSKALQRGDKLQFFIDIAQIMQDQEYWFLLTFHSYDGQQELRETECFQKVAQATYIVSLQAGQEIHPNTFNIIKDHVESNEKEIMVFDDTKRNITLIEKQLASNSYHKYNDYNIMVEELRKKAQEHGLHSSI